MKVLKFVMVLFTMLAAHAAFSQVKFEKLNLEEAKTKAKKSNKLRGTFFSGELTIFEVKKTIGIQGYYFKHFTIGVA